MQQVAWCISGSSAFSVVTPALISDVSVLAVLAYGIISEGLGVIAGNS